MVYRRADKSLARPGRNQFRKHVRRLARFQQHRDASCHQVFLPARQVAEGNSRHSDRNISLFPSWSGLGLISTTVLTPKHVAVILIQIYTTCLCICWYIRSMNNVNL